MRGLKLGSSLAMVGVAAVVALGCGSDDDGASGDSAAAGGGATDKPVEVEFIGADIGDPFYVSMKCGAEDAAEEFDVDLRWGGITGVDFADELTAFNAAVQRKPDGIITAPFDAKAFIQPVKAAMDSGISVVTVDGSLEEPVEIQNIRTDNEAAGAVAADAMADKLGSGDVAVVTYNMSVPVPKARVDGFVNKVKSDYPDLKVVGVEFGEADAAKAARVTAALMQRHPNLKGIYATDSSDAEGAASAIVAADRRGEIKLLGFDAGPKAVQGLKSGLYDGLIAQAPYDEGYDSVKLLAQVVREEVDPKTVEYQHWTGAFFVDKENLETPDAQKYLYQPTCN